MTEEHAPQMRFDREQIEKRIDVASELFASGFNCAQSVVAAFADLYGVDRDLALRMAAPFGGGIGRMREICGLRTIHAHRIGKRTDRSNQQNRQRRKLQISSGTGRRIPQT